MKKILFTLALLISICVNLKAQFYGGFAAADPNAWFDREIYFYCQNNTTSINMWGYQYGVNLTNVQLVINNQYRVDLNGWWNYGDYIFLTSDNGFEFDKGSNVALYVNGYYQFTWYCNSSNPSAIEVVKRAHEQYKIKMPKGTVGKLIKILRKVRL